MLSARSDRLIRRVSTDTGRNVHDHGNGRGFCYEHDLTVFFEDDFETDQGWTAAGFRNRSTLVGVVNPAFPTYVNLAPGDLSDGAFRGKSISLVFSFDTRDASYNGFRGWLIDSVSMTDVALSAGAPSLVAPPSTGVPMQLRGAH